MRVEIFFLSSSSSTKCMDISKIIWRSSRSSSIFWQEIKIKCYELIVVMCQNDIKSNNILNWFQATTKTNINIDVINNLCLWSQLNTLVMPYLFYINKETIGHNFKFFFSKIQVKHICLKQLIYNIMHFH
jgi:hypothetical protein